MKLIKIGLVGLLILMIALQTATAGRTRKNTGNAPIISSDADEIQVPCQYRKKDLLRGLTAYDVEDGYITDKILIGGFSDFTERGVSSLEYAVYDTDGNIAVFNRKVVFRDYAPPRIAMSEPWAYKATDNIYNMPTLSLVGTDKLDGDISKHILITSDDLDFSKPGKYTASVYLKNSFGDEVSMDLPVHILDPGLSGYTIELTEPLIYLEKGEELLPEQYVAAVRNEYTGEPIPEKEYELTIQSFVDTSKDGIYDIQFSAVSADKVQRGETWLTVVVGDHGG